jgi:Ca2+-transporting ATPase
MNHMTTTKLWHVDADEPIPIETGDEEAKRDAVTLRILRIGNIANNARLSRLNSHAQSQSSIAVLSSTQGRTPTQGLRSRWVGQPTDVRYA